MLERCRYRIIIGDGRGSRIQLARDAPRTSSLVQVAGLFRPDLLVEVEAVAWSGSSS
ncbi:MAG: hypothetical protein WAU75_01645 [Solirubrobacteraceae bacterium]